MGIYPKFRTKAPKAPDRRHWVAGSPALLMAMALEALEFLVVRQIWLCDTRKGFFFKFQGKAAMFRKSSGGRAWGRATTDLLFLFAAQD